MGSLSKVNARFQELDARVLGRRAADVPPRRGRWALRLVVGVMWLAALDALNVTHAGHLALGAVFVAAWLFYGLDFLRSRRGHRREPEA